MQNTQANTVVRTVISAAIFADKVEMAHADNFRRNNDNLQSLEFTDVAVENKNLPNAEFNFSKMTNVTFTNVVLEGSEFKFTEMHNVVFQNCKLERAYFEFAQMDNVQFVNCIMENTSYDYASGTVSFAACQLEGSEFHHTALAVKMSGCNGGRIEMNFCPQLTINAEKCDFHRGEFTDGTLSGTMNECVLTDAYFNGSNVEDLTFTECRMRDITKNGAVGFEKDDGDDEIDLDEIDFDFD